MAEDEGREMDLLLNINIKLVNCFYELNIST